MSIKDQQNRTELTVSNEWWHLDTTWVNHDKNVYIPFQWTETNNMSWLINSTKPEWTDERTATPISPQNKHTAYPISLWLNITCLRINASHGCRIGKGWYMSRPIVGEYWLVATTDSSMCLIFRIRSQRDRANGQPKRNPIRSMAQLRTVFLNCGKLDFFIFCPADHLWS